MQIINSFVGFFYELVANHHKTCRLPALDHFFPRNQSALQEISFLDAGSGSYRYAAKQSFALPCHCNASQRDCPLSIYNTQVNNAQEPHIISDISVDRALFKKCSHRVKLTLLAKNKVSREWMG